MSEKHRLLFEKPLQIKVFRISIRDFQTCAEIGRNLSDKMPKNVEARAWTISCQARVAEQRAEALKADQ